MIELFHLVKQDTELGATPSDSGKTNAINLQVLNKGCAVAPFVVKLGMIYHLVCQISLQHILNNTHLGILRFFSATSGWVKMGQPNQ